MLLIAHRGASGTHPENTLAAFRAAFRMGARAVETDIQQTKDGVLVLIHDFTLERLTGSKRKVRGMRYSELSRVDAGAGERIPMLEELLELAPKGEELHLEVKQPDPPQAGIEERLLGILARRPGRVVVSSFDARTLERLRKLDGRLRLAYLTGTVPLARALGFAARIRCEALHVSRRRLDAGWIREARARGLALRVYTVNTWSEARRLAAMGVSAVFTDYPDLRRRKEP
ncbi:MAG: glycerophosphodiester phosphodiesterase family protein [Elusimicrobiota bacterium]